jgi:trimeric autotransporter adhesin
MNITTRAGSRAALSLLLTVGAIATSAVQANTLFGTGALASNTTGYYDTAFGDDALNLNTTGYDNAADGAFALNFNTTGHDNTGIGYGALYNNATGDYNSGVGSYVLENNTTGANNTALGYGASFYNSTGSDNTTVGYAALNSGTTGFRNDAIGSQALLANTTGSYNNAIGFSALTNNSTGMYNTGVGTDALYSNTTGNYNSASGNYGLYDNTTGGYNNASGYGALYHNTTGAYNAGMGVYALFSNAVGSNNIAIGQLAGYYVTGSNNIDIGNKGTAADSAVIRFGVQGTQQATYIAGVSGVNVTGGATVVVNSQGQLGVVSSSRRYKEDIRSMGDASDRLLALRPVTFRYKKADENGQKPEQYGLIAEEVAKVMPELVVYNQKGQPETVAYQTLAPLLLNELKREHEHVVSLTRRVESQGELLHSMTAQLAELESLKSELADFRRASGNAPVSREK